MAPKKKSNKKQENLEEPVEEPLPNVVVEEPLPNVVVEEPVPNVVVEEPVPIVVVEEPVPNVVVKEAKKESIDLEISEIFNPLLSNDLENLSLKTAYRPPSPPPRRVNRRGATMGMKLGL